MKPDEAKPVSRRDSGRRRFLFRILAIGCGLTPFLAAEGIVRLTSRAEPTEIEDPYIGFDTVRPLFVLDDAGTRYETADNRLAFFQKVSFPARKAASEFRVFSLGGSTVWGRPYAKETAFSNWLELSLRAADPSRQWRVVNCGGVSYASYRLVEVLREVLTYQPDLIILYTGHNEFLEDRTYEQVKQTSPAIRFVHGLLSQSQAYMLCRRTWIRYWQGEQRSPADKDVLPADVEATLDYWGGLDHYHRDDQWRQGVVEHFRFNVQRMITMCRDAKTPIFVVNPVSNIRDIPPFKAEANTSLTEDQQVQVEELWGRARPFNVSDPQRAAELLRQALEIDDEHAGLHFHLATLYLALHRYDEARHHFLRAKDLDICPLRILEPMRAAIEQTCRQTQTPMIDLRPSFEAQSQFGIVGNELMADHVHPAIRTHQHIAFLLMRRMERAGYVTPTRGWLARRKAAYAANFAALPRTYFPRGQQRLEALRRWTQGRSSERRGRR